MLKNYLFYSVFEQSDQKLLVLYRFLTCVVENAIKQVVFEHFFRKRYKTNSFRVLFSRFKPWNRPYWINEQIPTRMTLTGLFWPLNLDTYVSAKCHDTYSFCRHCKLHWRQKCFKILKSVKQCLKSSKNLINMKKCKKVIIK